MPSSVISFGKYKSFIIQKKELAQEQKHTRERSEVSSKKESAHFCSMCATGLLDKKMNKP